MSELKNSHQAVKELNNQLVKNKEKADTILRNLLVHLNSSTVSSTEIKKTISNVK
jgi:hypothetical protein